MIATRWSRQDDYAAMIESVASMSGVPASLAYGLIGQESSFNPSAVRNEPGYYCAATGQTGDASYGLTQVLYCTALGLGYTGTPLGLFDPATNLSLGLLLLGRLLASHSGDTSAALSAYNGGDRPAFGYGARLADGTFRNQAYVDAVLANAEYFDNYLAQRDGVVTPPSPPDGTVTDVSTGQSWSGIGPVTAAALVGGGVLAWLLLKWLRV